MHLRDLKKQSIALFWLFSFLYWEILTHAGMYDQFQNSFWYAVGISGIVSALVALLVGLLPRKLVFPVGLILTVVLTFLYGSQMVYCFIFGTPYSISQMGLGAGAVSQFYREMLSTMAENWTWIAGLLLPLVVLIVLTVTGCMDRPGKKSRLAVLLLAVILVPVIWLCICRGGTHMFSDYYFFTSRKSI